MGNETCPKCPHEKHMGVCSFELKPSPKPPRMKRCGCVVFSKSYYDKPSVAIEDLQ